MSVTCTYYDIIFKNGCRIFVSMISMISLIIIASYITYGYHIGTNAICLNSPKTNIITITDKNWHTKRIILGHLTQTVTTSGITMNGLKHNIS